MAFCWPTSSPGGAQLATLDAGRQILEDAPTLRTALEDIYRAAIRIYMGDDDGRELGRPAARGVNLKSQPGEVGVKYVTVL